MFIFQPEKNQTFKKLSWYESAFSPEECKKITALFDPTAVQQAGVNKENNFNTEARRAELNWIHFDEKHRWLFDKIWNHVSDVNKNFYKFQLSGMYEALQLTHYKVGDHYGWHEDGLEPHFTTRKLSFVIQLTAPELYTGGSLVIFPGENASRLQGSISFFPSFITHKVEPVTHGSRFSLVGWVTGEPFR